MNPPRDIPSARPGPEARSQQRAPGGARWRGGTATDRLFILAVLIKGIDGLLEMSGAVLLFAMRPSMLNAVVAIATEHELFGRRSDVLFHALRDWFADLDARTVHFAAAYLVVHGGIKMFLALGLLAGRSWAYPLGSAFLALFIAYTLYRLSLGWSWVLLAFAVLDAVTLVLVLREWATARRSAEASAAEA